MTPVAVAYRFGRVRAIRPWNDAPIAAMQQWCDRQQAAGYRHTRRAAADGRANPHRAAHGRRPPLCARGAGAGHHHGGDAMTATVAAVDCPCIRPVVTPTAGRDRRGLLKPHVLAPRDDYDVCDGTGEARQLIATDPQRVRDGGDPSGLVLAPADDVRDAIQRGTAHA